MSATLDEASTYRPNPAWAEYVRRLVDQAPPLSPAQRDHLAVLLCPTRTRLRIPDPRPSPD